jgi:hypothetical protein
VGKRERERERERVREKESHDTQFSTVKGKLKINCEECGTPMSEE